MTPTMILALQLGPALLGAVLGLALDAFERRGAALAASALGLAVSGAFGLWAAPAAVSTVFGVLRVGGPFSAVPGLIALFAALALLGGWSQFVARPGGGSSAALIALAAVASGAVAQSYDLLMLLVALETTAAAGYALVAEARTRRADESALKYFVQGAIATGLFVMGLAILVGAFVPSGGYELLSVLFSKASAPTAALAGGILILSALAFKSSLVPFHAWAPDAYETARPEVAAFLASGPKFGALGALALFMVIVASGTLADSIVVVMAVVSGLSILVGSLGALRQRSYTRMLAYAGIAQAGYAVVAAVLLNPAIAVFFAATYALATTGTFLAATAFREARPDWDGSIDGLAGLGRRTPLLSASVALLLVSLAGIPPLLGFWGKFQVFAGAITLSARMFLVVGNSLMGWTYALLAFVGIVGSVVSLGYYGGVLQALYLNTKELVPTDGVEGDAPAGRDSAPAGMATWVVAATGILVLVLGLIPLFWGVAVLVLPFTVH